MTLQLSSVFDPAQEALDGRGWRLTYYDDANPIQVGTPLIEKFYRLTNSGSSIAQVTNKVLTTNVATLTTSAAHGFTVNQIVIVSIGDLVFDGVYTITVVGSSTTFSYARTNANVTTVTTTGTAKVAVFPAIVSTVTNKALTSNVATLTTGGPHGLVTGQYVTVATGDPIFDGTFMIASTPLANTLTYALVHADVSSAVATGTLRTARSLTERIKEIAAADPTILAYFTTVAQGMVLTANTATVTTDLNVLLAAEGLS